MSEPEQPSPRDGDVEKKEIDDAETREKVLEYGLLLRNFYDRELNELAAQLQRIDTVLTCDLNESVLRAAGHVKERILSSLPHMRWKRERLHDAHAAVEGSPRLLDVVGNASIIGDELKNERFLQTREKVDEIRAATDAIEFAATAGHEVRLRRVSDAMGRILGAVTELRKMGFEIGEIQSTVDEFINLRSQYDFSLLAPVISDSDTKGTKRNKRSNDKQRERLLAEDKWVLRFLNDFWFRYWRLAFEQSLPDVEHEANITLAREVIPSILDAETEPMDLRYLQSVALGKASDRRREIGMENSRVRIRDEHVLTAVARLVEAGESEPRDVVELEGDIRKYWTRRRAEAASLKIADKSQGDDQHRPGK
jgi:hypothetical protein